MTDREYKPNFVHGFSRNEKIGSKVIRWGTAEKGEHPDEVPSHYFMIFFRKIVLESRLESGVRITYWGAFLKKNTIIKLFVPAGEAEKREKRGRMFSRILENTYGKAYDFMAVLYYSYRILLKKWFGKKMPKKNKWNHEDKFFCDEIYSEVSGEDMSMKSPNDLMKYMSANPAGYKEISKEQVIA